MTAECVILAGVEAACRLASHLQAHRTKGVYDMQHPLLLTLFLAVSVASHPMV